MNRSILLNFGILILILIVVMVGCKSQTQTVSTITTSTSTSTLSPNTYSLTELKYILIANYPDLFWCDPDYYPIGSTERELQNALNQFDSILSNQEEFSVILKHVNLTERTSYSDEEKLLIYRQHKELTLGFQMIPNETKYDFILRTGEGQGYRISGTISFSGVINVLTTEPSFNTCPICLARGTLIDTPAGSVKVEDLRVGMSVWTSDENGQRLEAIILKISSTAVPNPFMMLRIKLKDDRTITASSLHPSTEGKPLGEYAVGDVLDGELISSIEMVFYDGCSTYDLLPSGLTGYYWADGILLRSTLN